MFNLSKSFINCGSRLIYQKKCNNSSPLKIIKDDFVVSCSSVKQIECLSKKYIIPGSFFKISEYIEHKNITYWFGITDNQIVFQAKTSVNHERYFVPVNHDQAVISHCRTIPEYRGRGFYLKGLEQIMYLMSKMGIYTFYIDCNDWNWPSKKGIETAGFELIGYGRDHNGKLTYKPKKKKLKEMKLEKVKDFIYLSAF